MPSAEGTIGIVLAPMDAAVGNVGGRRGAAEGPSAIHQALAKRDALEDCVVKAIRPVNDPRALVADLRLLEDAVVDAKARFDRVLVLGGDHGTTYASVTGVRRAMGAASPVSLAYLDVHWDMRPYEPYTSGSSFRRLLDEGTVTGAHLHPIGIERPSDPARLRKSRFDELAAYATGKGVEAVLLADARGGALETVLSARLGASVEPRYLSVDMDVVSEDEVRGVSAPGPDRIALRDVVAAVACAAPAVVAADVVETAPPLDPSGLTVEAAADVAQAILDGWRGAPTARLA